MPDAPTTRQAGSSNLPERIRADVARDGRAEAASAAARGTR